MVRFRFEEYFNESCSRQVEINALFSRVILILFLSIQISNKTAKDI